MSETKQTKPIEKPTKTVQFEGLYEKLSKPIPKEFLIDYVEDGKKFTGYHAQYAIDLLNKVVGLGKWHTVCEIRKEELISGSWAVAGMITILIRWNDKDFAVNGFGGSYAKDIANAYKGFKTSAFKNACRYLGIGKELYVAGFEDDIQNNKKEEEVLPETDNELAKKIDSAQSVDELDSLKDAIQYVEGKSVKEVLLKKYNNKKISLIEEQ